MNIWCRVDDNSLRNVFNFLYVHQHTISLSLVLEITINFSYTDASFSHFHIVISNFNTQSAVKWNRKLWKHHKRNLTKSMFTVWFFAINWKWKFRLLELIFSPRPRLPACRVRKKNSEKRTSLSEFFYENISREKIWSGKFSLRCYTFVNGKL